MPKRRLEIDRPRGFIIPDLAVAGRQRQQAQAAVLMLIATACGIIISGAYVLPLLGGIWRG